VGGGQAELLDRQLALPQIADTLRGDPNSDMRGPVAFIVSPNDEGLRAWRVFRRLRRRAVNKSIAIPHFKAVEVLDLGAL